MGKAAIVLSPTQVPMVSKGNPSAAALTGPNSAKAATQHSSNDGTAVVGRLVEALGVSHSRCDLSVPDMARMLGIHHRTLQRRLRREAGCSPAEFLNRYRLSRAHRLLLAGRPVTEVAMEVGYKSTSHFSTKFKSVFGSAPSRVRATATRQ